MTKRVLITGCSSGIGRALASELTSRGHTVIATARRLDSIADLEVAEKHVLDVTSTQSVEELAARVGAIDVLVNNAGVTVWGAVDSPDETEVQRLFETNVFGALRMLRAFLPGMRARRSGAVFQISSAVSRRSTALLGHYAATKAALDAYSEALRIELAQYGIDVCIVVLGAVETRFGENRREVITPDYADLAEKVKARLARSRKAPWSAEHVATRVADAIEGGKPPLRIDGTSDAFALTGQRASISDEVWEKQTLQEIWNPAD